MDRKAMYLSCAPENILILSFTLFIKISPFFQFLFLSNFLHLKSANIIIVSCRCSFINSDCYSHDIILFLHPLTGSSLSFKDPYNVVLATCLLNISQIKKYYSGIFRLLYFLGVIPWYSLNLRMK